MSIDPISGRIPLRDAQGVTGGVASLRGNEAAGQADEFSNLIGNAIADVAQNLRKAEAVSIAGIKGMASTQDVVEQVMQAEQALQASIAVRDKVVAAYLEISRMQI